jgi:dolichyl-phosphate-mannose-protein mannosyltransferase
MARPVRFFFLWIGLGLAARLAALGLWGTFDTEVQKAWSARAATAGVADIYGPPDRELLESARAHGGSLVAALTQPVPKTTFRWGSADYFVDYPPGSVLGLWVAGKLYGLMAPGLPNRRLFNAAINLLPLVGSLAIALLLWRSAEGGLGQWRALVFWLNPAVYLAAPVLGYQDPIFAALALAAVMTSMRGRHVAAAALGAAAMLVKPQGALLLPVLAAVVLRESHPRVWVKAALAGVAMAAVLLLPWWTSGYLLSAIDGFRRPLSQGTLAPLGFNVWWIAGYAMRWVQAGPWPLAEIVTIDVFRAWAGFDPRLVSRALLAAATLVNLWLLWRSPRDDRRMVPLCVILQVHAYALLGTSVHENHTFLAVALAPLLLGVWPRAGALVAAASAFLFASLYLTAGLGRRITTQSSLESLRAAFGVDLTVLVAVAHIVFVAVLLLWVARTSSGELRSVAP